MAYEISSNFLEEPSVTCILVYGGFLDIFFNGLKVLSIFVSVCKISHSKSGRCVVELSTPTCVIMVVGSIMLYVTSYTVLSPYYVKLISLYCYACKTLEQIDSVRVPLPWWERVA